MRVQIRCICPLKNGKPRHAAGDTVVLRDRLGFRGAHAIKWAVALQQTDDPNAAYADTLALLSENYLIHGIESWTVRTEAAPLPVTAENIRTHLLSQVDVASELADRADDLYGEVILPLLQRASTSSPSTSTDESTSPPSSPEMESPTPSKRSSTSTSRTVGTETTSLSLVGDSNLSPSSESAA